MIGISLLTICSISGLDWVRTRAVASGKPSVVNMSLGGFESPPLDNAVSSLVASGIHVAVAAGNSGLPSNIYSPARASGVVAVAATDITDTRPNWSNWGSPVKIFAPGQDVISSWSTSDTVCQCYSAIVDHLLIISPGYK
jgi:cerevisin